MFSDSQAFSVTNVCCHYFPKFYFYFLKPESVFTKNCFFLLDIWASKIYIFTGPGPLFTGPGYLYNVNLVKILPDIWACIIQNSQVLVNFYWVKAEDLGLSAKTAEFIYLFDVKTVEFTNQPISKCVKTKIK